tara:strand:+ start:562 stop:795 length:234 start_codon:yes stop_codon:yes gene_type:complete
MGAFGTLAVCAAGDAAAFAGTLYDMAFAPDCAIADCGFTFPSTVLLAGAVGAAALPGLACPPAGNVVAVPVPVPAAC